MIEAVLRLDPVCELAELDSRLIADEWGKLLTARGWDGSDVRCRLDNYRQPYR